MPGGRAAGVGRGRGRTVRASEDRFMREERLADDVARLTREVLRYYGIYIQ